MNKVFEILFYHFLFFFTLGQLMRFDFPWGGLYAHDIVIVVWLAYWGATNRAYLSNYSETVVSFFRKKGKNTEKLFIFWLVGVTTLSLITEPSLVQLAYILRFLTYILFCTTLGSVFSGVKLSNSFSAAAAGIATLGFLQYIFLPDTRFLHFLGWDDHYYRLISTLLDPAFTGMLFVLFFIVLSQLRSISVHLQTLSQIVIVVGILLTYSRSSYLAFLISLIGLTVYSLLGHQLLTKSKTLFFLIYFGLALFFLPKPGGEGTNLQRTSSIVARQTNVSTSLNNLSSKEWVIGKGLFKPSANLTNEKSIPSHAKFPDNIIVLVLTQTGIPGILLSVMIVIKTCLRLWRKAPLTIVSFAALIIHSQFQPTLIQPFILLWWLGGIVVPEQLRIREQT